MRTNITGSVYRLIFCVAVMLGHPLSGLGVGLAAADERPNIVLMLADDQGWAGLSVAMHPEIKGSRGEYYHTPNLEKLAAQGMRFSAAYAPASVCSPTRISLQTGKSPAQLHWTKAAPAETGHKLIEPQLIKRIADSEVTIAELLRDASYATAHYGKWHISGGGPERHGYDESDGDTGNEQAFKYKDPNPVDIVGMAERTAAFMKKNAAKKKPFFIQLSWNALHASQNANAATLAKYQNLMGSANSKQISIAAITEDLDTGVGKVLESIDQLGLARNTYVIYMSDNGAGGGGARRVLNGGKGGMWEGGIRVPLIIRGPNVKPNSWCHTRVVGYDLFPTFCDWSGIDAQRLPKGVEGGSIASLLKNGGQGSVRRPREELVFHFPHYQGDAPHSAILLGNLKLLHFYEDGRDLLFDLTTDISERNDLSKTRVTEARQLRERLDKYLADVQAQLPTRNPSFSGSDDQSGKRAGKKRNGKESS